MKVTKRYNKMSLILIICMACIVSVVIAVILRSNALPPNIIDKTYCSDVCPSMEEVDNNPFQVYKNVDEKQCTNLGGTANYAYGWSNEYLGCTPKGYTTLQEATKAMWRDYRNKN